MRGLELGVYTVGNRSGASATDAPTEAAIHTSEVL
jgi:hypothetical protein